MAVNATTVFTPRQLEELWIRAGGAAGAAPLMAAIAEAESGGAPTNENVAGRSTTNLAYQPPYTAYSPTGDYSVGLWQENFYQALGPERVARYRKRWGGPANPTAYAQWLRVHPLVQAKIARDLYAGGAGLSNWQGDAAVQAYEAEGAGALTPFLQQQGPQGGGNLPPGVGGLVGPSGPSSVQAQPVRSIQVPGWGTPSISGGPPVHTGGSLGSILGLPSPGEVEAYIVRAGVGLVGVLLVLGALFLFSKAVTSKTILAGVGGLVTGETLGKQRERKAQRAEAGRERERREERHQAAQTQAAANVKRTQAQATELRTRTRHRRRAKAEQQREVEHAYRMGAADQMHHAHG